VTIDGKWVTVENYGLTQLLSDDNLLGALLRSFAARSVFYPKGAGADTQRSLLIGSDYWDAGMHRAYDVAVRFGVDPVCKPSQLFINPPPEAEAVSHRGRCRNVLL
jgi:hypothetical protein